MASHAFLSRCVDANSSGVKLIFCPDASVSGPWSYDEESQMLVHRRGNRCFYFSSDNKPQSPAAPVGASLWGGTPLLWWSATRGRRATSGCSGTPNHRGPRRQAPWWIGEPDPLRGKREKDSQKRKGGTMQNQAATVWRFQPIENANTNQRVTNQHPSYIAWTFWNEDQFFFVITSPEQSRSWSLWGNLYVQYFPHLCCFLVRNWNALNPLFGLTAYCDKYHFNQLEPLSLQLPRPVVLSWNWQAFECDPDKNASLWVLNFDACRFNVAVVSW